MHYADSQIGFGKGHVPLFHIFLQDTSHKNNLDN